MTRGKHVPRVFFFFVLEVRDYEEYLRLSMKARRGSLTVEEHQAYDAERSARAAAMHRHEEPVKTRTSQTFDVAGFVIVLCLSAAYIVLMVGIAPAVLRKLYYTGQEGSEDDAPI